MAHLFRLAIGHDASALIIGDVSFLAKRIQQRDQLWLGTDRRFERLDYSVVMLVTRRAIACRRERRGGRLLATRFASNRPSSSAPPMRNTIGSLSTAVRK